MKKTLILGALLAGAVGAQAQGTVNFADTGAYVIHIYAPQASGLAVQGNAGNDVPSGSTAYDAGSAIGGSGAGTGYGNGNNVSVELYGLTGTGDSLASVEANPLTQYVGHLGTKSAAAAGLFIPTGSGADPGIPNTTASSGATVALAAWWNPANAYPTIGAAQAAGQAYGWSDTANIATLGGFGTPPGTPPPIGVTSFSLVTSSPEPSTIALGIMGASAFLARRRFSK